MFRALTLLVPEDVADDVSALLIESGADGVEVEEPGARLMPGKEPPPAGTARLIGYFSPESNVAALGATVEDFLGHPVGIDERPIPDQDWNEVWKSHFSPLKVSDRLWICPSWRLGETPPEARTLVLDPGMAFGTGTHATTSLCLEGVDAFLAERPGASVLDVGTGSGILAIAAKLLGGGRVAATDNDPVAVQVASENAAINQVELDLSTRTLAETGAPFDLVVANIMANTLIELAPELARCVAAGGELLLSGVLDFQCEEVAAAYDAEGLVRRPFTGRGEWVLLHFTKAPA